MATTTRTRSSTAKRSATPRRRTTRAAATPKATSLRDDAAKVVRSAKTRATRAVKSVPTDTRTLTIAGILAGAVAAGVALFMNRDRVRDVASTGGEKLKQVADDLSTLAHEKIDLARDNITKFRSRNEPTAAPAADSEQSYAAVS